MHQLKFLLETSNASLSVAESLTGGLLSSEIVGISGISSFYYGGVTTYSLESKQALLNVPLSHTKKTDAVDGYTAESMAKGVTRLFSSDIGLATTGIAECWDDREEQAFVALFDARTGACVVHHLRYGTLISEKGIRSEDVRMFVRTSVMSFCMEMVVSYLRETTDQAL